MILATHSIVGAAVAQFFPNNPVAGFFAAFASHFLLDLIPHKDYALHSSVGFNSPEKFHLNKASVIDFEKIAFDFSVGLAISVAILPDWRLAIIGAFGGIFPDALQFAAKVFPCWPLVFLLKIHHRIQKHIENAWGIIFQAVVVAVALVLVKFFA